MATKCRLCGEKTLGSKMGEDVCIPCTIVPAEKKKFKRRRKEESEIPPLIRKEYLNHDKIAALKNQTKSRRIFCYKSLGHWTCPNPDDENRARTIEQQYKKGIYTSKKEIWISKEAFNDANNWQDQESDRKEDITDDSVIVSISKNKVHEYLLYEKINALKSQRKDKCVICYDNGSFWVCPNPDDAKRSKTIEEEHGNGMYIRKQEIWISRQAFEDGNNWEGQ